jgi:beta-glucanase (GH16 family)
MFFLRILFLSLGLGMFPFSLFSQCYELVWSEEFDSTGLPVSENWNLETGGGGWGNNELQYYRADTSSVKMEDGILVITARKENYGGNSYTSARITTKDKVEFRYGRVEASLRLPYGQGIWPAFWLLGDNISEAGWPACGETDIMEMIGGTDRDNVIHGTAHWDNNGSHAQYGRPYSLSSGIYADTFHVFSVEWTPKTMKWYMDGNLYNTIDITPSGLSEFHHPFFIILNLAVGGNWPGNPDASTVFPQRLEADYIRVYRDISSLEILGEPVTAQLGRGKRFSLPRNDAWTYQWSIPEDAEITGGQGTSEIIVDWGCQDGAVECTLTGNCGSSTLTLPVTVENSIRGPMFVDEGAEGQLFYLDEMPETSYNWSVPGDAEVAGGQGTDSVLVNWGSLFTGVSVQTANSCGDSTYFCSVLKTGQYPYPDPYSPHVIPGVILATDYDYGGEGMAYHDLSNYNEGSGVRQDEWVDTEYNDNGSANVGWITTGEWLEYSIRVDSGRYYELSLRVATNNASGGPFSIWINGEERLGTIAVPGTGGWNQFITLRPGLIRLNQSDTLLRVRFDQGGFNLGNISFEAADVTSSGPVPSGDARVVFFPNPASDVLHLSLDEREYTYRIMDLTGSVVLEGVSKGEKEPLDIRGLRPGIYLLVLQTPGGHSYSGRFVKVS